MVDRIDWAALAERVANRPRDSQPREALAEILGEEALEAAVERYVALLPGSELVEKVLALVRPLAAMRSCYRIYRHDPSVERRRRAVELLRAVGDVRAVGWIGEFLRDPDGTVQAQGAGLLDHLLWNFLVESEEVELELRSMRDHENPQVRERYGTISGYLAARVHE